MQSRQQHTQQFSCKRRLVFICIGFFLLLLAATFLILNTLGIIAIKSSLSNTLIVIFTVLGSIFAFGQWVVPLPPIYSEKKFQQSSTSQLDRLKTAPLFNTFSSQVVTTFPPDHEVRKKLEQDSNIRYGDDGALIIYVTEESVGQAATLYFFQSHSVYGKRREKETYTAYASKYAINGYSLFAAVFPRLSPGNYHVAIPTLKDRPVTIFSNQIVEIDIKN